MKNDFSKFAKQLLKNFQRSIEAEARHHERKAGELRALPAMMKKFEPLIFSALKPPKFPKLTKRQLAKMRTFPASPVKP